MDFQERLSGFGSSRYQQLRPAQVRALDGYSRLRDRPDVAVELPTGFGKTLVALLIADQALEEGRTVAYLTGTNQLADQVLAQCTDLPGLDAVKFSAQYYPPGSLAAYHDARAVGVMNYWTYFNSSPKVEPADLVIFDDAHLAEQPLAGLFAIRVDARRQKELYERLCDLVLAHTDLYPTVELMRSGAAGPTVAPELLAFPHWAAVSERAAAILADQLPRETALFVWPTVQPRLNACGVLIGPSAIEIRPYHPPTQTVPGYRAARQRLYLSATLGTMDDLQRRLGVAPVVNVLEAPITEEGIGRRLLLIAPDEDRSPEQVDPREFALEQARSAGRTAWLCSSHQEADGIETMLEAVGPAVFRLRGGDDSALERWLASSDGHLVTAGRYDGLDLPGDACRLVVLPSIPAASTEFERFVMAYLGDATFMRHRVGQRVTQALGRANRSEDDWAMYLALAPGFATMLAQSGVRQAIPADVRPDIDAALARMDGGWSAARAEAHAFWTGAETASGKPQDAAAPAARPRPGRTKPAATAGSAVHEVAAVTRLWLGDLDGAAEHAERAALALTDAGEIEHAAFWRYVRAQALYRRSVPGFGGRAIDALREATQAGTATVWFVRLGRVLAELRGEQAASVDEQPWLTWDQWIGEAGPAGVARALARCRQGLSGTHDQQADALCVLGRIAGIGAERPVGQSATDTIWSWASTRKAERRLWEVKTGEPDAIPRDWVDQTLGQIAAARPSTRLRVVGCLLTSLPAAEPGAAEAARESIALVHRDAAEALAELLGERLTEYARRYGGGSAAERGAAREAVERRMPGAAGWLAELLGPSNGRVLRRGDVLSRFPA